MNADDAFEKIADDALQQFLNKNPEWATFLGLHDPYDKLLSNGSIELVHENLRLLEEWLHKIQTKIDFDELNEEHKMDWRLLQYVHEIDKFYAHEYRAHEKNPEALEGIGSLIFIVLTREYAPLEARIEGIVSRLEKLPAYLDQFRNSFKNCVPVKLWTEIAIEQCQQIPGYLQFLITVTKERISQELHQKLQKAITDLSQPLNKHLEWLKALLPKAKTNWVIGREKLERLLNLRDLGFSADEIHELGVKFLRETKEERAKLAAKISPGKTVEKVMKEIQSEAPKTFEEALEFTRKEMERARSFVLDNDIATILGADKLHVEETPSFMAPLIPTAALVLPAKYEKTQEGIYIVTRPKDMKDLGKHANYASIPSTVVHEAFPGHFLQTSRSNRLGSFIRYISQGTETVEGWAHYCEEMMMNHGFQGGANAKLMQVNRIVFRAVRMIVDVKLSCGEMTFNEAVDMLVSETGMSKNVAIAEVRRYTMTPGYALSYLLGKHLILKLRDEVREKMGPKYSEKFFHDTITANGYLPIAKLRETFEQRLRASRNV